MLRYPTAGGLCNEALGQESWLPALCGKYSCPHPLHQNINIEKTTVGWLYKFYWVHCSNIFSCFACYLWCIYCPRSQLIWLNLFVSSPEYIYFYREMWHNSILIGCASLFNCWGGDDYGKNADGRYKTSGKKKKKQTNSNWRASSIFYGLLFDTRTKFERKILDFALSNYRFE